MLRTFQILAIFVRTIILRITLNDTFATLKTQQGHNLPTLKDFKNAKIESRNIN